MDIMNAQGYRTQRNDMPEDLAQGIWDRVQYPAAGVANLTWFSAPLGQTASLIVNGAVSTTKTKTYRDTNMQNAGVMPSKLYKIGGISIAYIHLTEGLATNGADRDRLKGGGDLLFKIGDKEILRSPLINLPEINPISAASTTANNTTIMSQASGGGAQGGIYKFAIPVTIEPYQNFQFTMNFDGSPTLSFAVDILVTFHALMRRPT